MPATTAIPLTQPQPPKIAHIHTLMKIERKQQPAEILRRAFTFSVKLCSDENRQAKNKHSHNIFNKDVNSPILISIYSWKIQWITKKKKWCSLALFQRSHCKNQNQNRIAEAKPKILISLPVFRSLSLNKRKYCWEMKVNKQTIDLFVSKSICKAQS